MTNTIYLAGLMSPIKTKTDVEKFFELTKNCDVSIFYGYDTDGVWFRNCVEEDDIYVDEKTGKTHIFSGDHCFTNEWDRKNNVGKGADEVKKYIWKYRKIINQALKETEPCEWRSIEKKW